MGQAHAADRKADTLPPNIVMIISDDQAYRDFGFMGNGVVKTPHLDRLASRSARFLNGYVPSSVCRPSLVTLLTGQYPHEHGVHFNHPPPGFAKLRAMPFDAYVQARERATSLIQRAPSVPRILSALGYRCLQTGKFWEGHHRNAGFTHGMTRGQPSPIENPLGLRDYHGNGDAGLSIGRVTMKPIFDFIDDAVDQHGERRHPFFVWYAPFLPHTPHTPPKTLLNQYQGQRGVAPGAAAYLASCTWFDQTVGALLKHIEARGLISDTVFVFVIDNGWRPLSTGKVDRRTKRSPYDMGLRTPVLLRWDGHLKPATHHGLVSSVDIAPTLLELVRRALPRDDQVAARNASIDAVRRRMSGQDLLPAAIGEKPLASDRAVFGEVYPGDATVLGDPSRDIAYRWVRQGRFKLIVPHVRNGKVYGNYTRSTQLFDVVADPHERTDLGLAKEHRQRVQAMKKLLDAWWSP